MVCAAGCEATRELELVLEVAIAGCEATTELELEPEVAFAGCEATEELVLGADSNGSRPYPSLSTCCSLELIDTCLASSRSWTFTSSIAKVVSSNRSDGKASAIRRMEDVS